MSPIAPTRAAFAVVAVVAVLLFAGSATMTALRFMSMTAMSGTPMPGGWSLSAAWLPLCGGTWLKTARSFVSMWASMMPAMMLPALAPMLWRERRTLANRSGWLIIFNAIGYFMVWLLAGIAIFPLGAAIASLATRVPSIAHAAPIAAGFVVMAAGVLQCTSWKARRLQSCHSILQCHDAASAMRVGIRFALHCASCCGNWMAVLLATGVMDREGTLIVSAAIAIERVAASRGALVRLVGVTSMAAGVLLIVHAI